VLNAYEQLLAEGYFESRAGAGTWIASSLPQRAGSRAPKKVDLVDGARTIAAHAAALPPYERATWAENLGPFQIGQPELRSFPVESWSRLLGRYSRNMRVKALQYGDAMGLPELREAIAGYLRRSRGARCEPG